ncbi:MAG: glycosyltransferase [Microcystaceae cyanobacterium]
MTDIFVGFLSLSLLIWLYLLGLRGGFWLSNQRIEDSETTLTNYPRVCTVIPARNEADVLPISLKSLLTQDYPGQFSIILVDDQSTDQTGQVAQEIAQKLEQSSRLTVISGQPLAQGWTGKLWALKQGIEAAQQLDPPPQYILLSDADISHHDTNVQELVTKAERENLDLTSLMVKLRCQSGWEKFLIPSFVFFFQKLYPFPWINNPERKMAGAAGGCILISQKALTRIGGIESVKNALIDDCSLAYQVKSTLEPKSGGIWLGLTEKVISLRPYDTLDTIWNMVARTAYTQLSYSPWLLMGTVLGMIIVYLLAPIGAIVGLITGNILILGLSLLTWVLMTLSYLPTLKLYQLSPLWGVALPAIAFLYNLMTIDSALRHWRGEGGAWKGRVYSGQ